MKKEVEEIKAYVEGVLHGHVITEQMGYCRFCGKWGDLRLGVCFDCAFPNCTRPTCPFRKLVYCGQGKKRIWKDLTYKMENGKIKCDRRPTVCSDQEYAIALDKSSCESAEK